MNPKLKKKELHNGIDIAVCVGTNVVAIQSGKVTQVGKSETFGNFLKYKTNTGYTVMYAHLKNAIVKVGDVVEQGQVVAESGNTGLTTGPHLHYSLWKKDVLIDPFPYVKLSYTDDVKKEYEERGETIH